MHQNNHDKYKGYLKRRILIPLAVIIILTVAAFSVATVWHVRNAIDREAKAQVEYTALTYSGEIEDGITHMASLLDLITQDEGIRLAFEQQDRKRLLELATPYFRPLNDKLHITHFYFTRSDRTNLLRVHNPSRYGDRIERYTTLKAEQSQQLTSGVEMGVLGTFTLRVVKPWFHNGALLGYVELGEEIDHIVDRIRQTQQIELFVFINKQQLDRKEWERGMHMLGRETRWDDYPDHILINAPKESATETIPPQLKRQLQHSNQIVLNRIIDIAIPAEYYKATFLPLEDVRGQRVGMMLLMSPQEHWFTHGRNTIIGATLFFLLIGGAVFILFYRLADKTERVLANTERQLLDEASENEYLHTQHILDLEQQNRLLEQASTEVEANRSRLEEAQRIAHIGSWEWDITSGALNWSDEVYRIFGYQPGEIEATYQAFLQSIHPADRAEVEQAVHKTLDSGRPYEIEHRVIRPDGSERIVREQGEVDLGEQQQPQRMIGTVHDITKRKRAEQRSRQLGHIFDNASNEIYLLDQDKFEIIEANHTAARRLDYSPHELRELNYLEIASDLTHERFLKLITPLEKGKTKEVRFEAIHRCKNGENYPVEIRLQRSDLDNRQFYIAMVLDISERLQQELTLKHQASHDALTDLPNRLMLGNQIQHEVNRAQQKQYPLTLLQLNLDDFGAVNDTLGHDNGDELLRQLATRLKNAVRPADTVARIGGDEFAVLMPDTGMDEIEESVEQLRQTITSSYQIGDYAISIEVAIGIAVYPDHAESARELLQHADVALKRAKAFHSMTEIYRPDFDPFSVRRLILNSHIRSAIARGEFALHYQPKVAGDSGQIHCAEALIRWIHPEHGFISPAEFIPLAEKTGYIKQITMWVIEEAARQLATWHAQGVELTISVNLSARNLQDPELINYIIDMTKRYQIEPQHLGFEVTETAVMLDPDYTQSLLQDLNYLGHPIAIDDYGTGYSSLAYIHRLPADELKIDSSFIFDMLSNDDSMLIVRSTVELAHNLNMRITAEGVETAGQADELRRMGTDLLQGFHFSRALPAAEFINLIADQGAGHSD